MKIYTKTGDDGTTGLFGGGRVSKGATRIEAYGTVDELNSVIGLALCYVNHPELREILTLIQHELFVLGADLATPETASSSHIRRVVAADVSRLEETIDRTEEKLEPLKNFILPGGSKSASQLHLARNVCRRAERLTVRLAAEEAINRHALTYMNRLSDLLFVLARWANRIERGTETTWKGS